MSAPRRAGDPLPPRDPADWITETRLTLMPLDLIAQWQRCGIAADFLANYLVFLFENRVSAHHMLATGLNELIENLAKFSADKRRLVEVVVAHHGHHLHILTFNQARGAQARALADRLDRMASTDPELLFLEQIEHTANNDRAASGLGLITIKKDYGALIGATLTPVDGAEDLYDIALELVLDVPAVEAN